MSAAVLVIYDGQPDDPEAFWRYYINVHVPLVWRFPRIRAVQVERVVDGDAFMIARFLFETPSDAKAALASPERAVARADRDRFPPFKGAIRHLIVDVVEMENPAV